MVTTLTLLTWSLTVGQAPDRSEWLLAPQYVPGWELTYAGSYKEKSLIPGVEHRREYRLETTLLVLEASPRHWDVAVMTVLGLQNQRPGNEPSPSSVRLEIAAVDRHGLVRGKNGKDLLTPLDGPPTVETGAFVSFPIGRVGRHQDWPVLEEGRPPRAWHIVGTEAKNGATCLKLAGQQQSETWSQPRADQPAWRRRDTVWILPQLGIPCRVERVIERRDPARLQPTFVTEVAYDLGDHFRYTGKFFQDRQEEILRAGKFLDEARALWHKPALYRPQLDVLLHKINYHLKDHRETPYRKAVVQVQRLVDRARKGEAPVEAAAAEEAQPVAPVRVGQRAPDFIVSEITGPQTTRFYHLHGRPILLFFYNPASDIGPQVLRFALALRDKYGGRLALLALAASRDGDLVRRQHRELQLPFPVHDGLGMQLTFGVDATPRFVVLDADGIVRGTNTGWGDLVPREIDAELQALMPRR